VPVTLTTVVTDDAGRVAFRSEEHLDSRLFEPDRRAYRHQAQIPVKDLPPGEYLAEITAETPQGDAPTVAQRIPLRVIEDRDATR
jgi:hypothetical protein